jgi:hypothetical protein
VFNSAWFFVWLAITIGYIIFMGGGYYGVWIKNGSLVKEIPAWKNTNKISKWYVYWVSSFSLVTLGTYIGAFAISANLDATVFADGSVGDRLGGMSASAIAIFVSIWVVVCGNHGIMKLIAYKHKNSSTKTSVVLQIQLLTEELSEQSELSNQPINDTEDTKRNCQKQLLSETREEMLDDEP